MIILLTIILLIIVLLIIIFGFTKNYRDTYSRYIKDIKDIKDTIDEEFEETFKKFFKIDIKFKLERPQTPIILQTFDQIQMNMRTWNGLKSDVPMLMKYFNVFWLPPPTLSTGNPGYFPKSYKILDSFFGTEEEFTELIDVLNKNHITPLVDIVFHHMASESEKKWWKIMDYNYSEPKDYVKLWNSTNFFSGSYSNYIVENLNSSCITSNNKINKTCIPNPKTKNIDCDKVIPLYGIDPTIMDAGGLTPLNLCNFDILYTQMDYLNKLYSLGVDGFRYDQANGIPYQLFKLYNNSDPNKTFEILKEINNYCSKVETYKNCPNIYDFKDKLDKLTDKDIYRLTGPPHKYAVAECFTYSTTENLHYDYPNHSWWALTNVLSNMNKGLNSKDRIGVFDFTLERLIYKTFGFGVSNDDMVMFPKKGIDSDYWYNSWNGRIIEATQNNKKEINIPLVYYNNQYYVKQNPTLVYTFVTNHDNDGIMKMYGKSAGYIGFQDEGFVSYNRMLPAYFIILMMPGIPVVWAFHFNWFKDIRVLIQLRNFLGIKPNSSLFIDKEKFSDNVITWTILGNKKYLCAIIDPISNIKQIPNNKLIFEYKCFRSYADPTGQILLHIYETN